METRYTYTGEVDPSGTLKIYNRRGFTDCLRSYAGKKVDITVERHRISRSREQNAYYWAVVVPVVCEGFNGVGYEFDMELTHEFLKSKFNEVEIINTSTGEILTAPGSTTKMTTVEMMGYFERIARWAAEYLGVNIPQPNEQVKMELQ